MPAQVQAMQPRPQPVAPLAGVTRSLRSLGLTPGTDLGADGLSTHSTALGIIRHMLKNAVAAELYSHYMEQGCGARSSSARVSSQTAKGERQGDVIGHLMALAREVLPSETYLRLENTAEQAIRWWGFPLEENDLTFVRGLAHYEWGGPPDYPQWAVNQVMDAWEGLSHPNTPGMGVPAITDVVELVRDNSFPQRVWVLTRLVGPVRAPGVLQAIAGAASRYRAGWTPNLIPADADIVQDQPDAAMQPTPTSEGENSPVPAREPARSSWER